MALANAGGSNEHHSVHSETVSPQGTEKIPLWYAQEAERGDLGEGERTGYLLLLFVLSQ
jgi:hypothetical protein